MQDKVLHADFFFHSSLVGKRSPIIGSAGIILTPYYYNLCTPKSQITCVVQCTINILALGKCFTLKLLIRTVVFLQFILLSVALKRDQGCNLTAQYSPHITE